MREGEAKELFRQITQEYFAGATVIFSNQSRAAKFSGPLIVITPGPIKRPSSPVRSHIDGELVNSYPSRITFTVDLFTHGAPVIDDESGQTVAYENTATEDMLSYVDFLNSDYVIELSHRNDVAVLVDGDVTDLTGIINDTNYEYRARISVWFSFMHRAIGRTAVLAERSVLYPDGHGGFTPVRPIEKESPTGGYITEAMRIEAEAVVRPDYNETSTGGGSDKLAAEQTGYFTEVEIKEEKS